jgi:hypothetical protein
MSDFRIKERVGELREDFERVTGETFSHFYCPILRTDHDTPLCEGHVIPDALKTCTTWVPQRADLDSFYGSMTEADFINVVQNRTKTPFDIWINPKLRSLYRPKLTMGDKPIGHYFPREATHVPGHSRGR